MSTLRTITDFKTALQGGGARANLFEVDIPTIPAVATQGIDWDAENFQFLCKAAALPASNVAPIEVPFRGRTLKVAGDRTFDTWTVTVINDEDFALRHAFEAWMNLLSKLDNATGAVNPASYMVDANVFQLGRSNRLEGTQVRENVKAQGQGFGASGSGDTTVLRSYKFVDIWPSNVSAIDVSYDTTDAIEEFTVEFQVQYFEMNDGPGNLR